jgi:hypothetical protein
VRPSDKPNLETFILSIFFNTFFSEKMTKLIMLFSMLFAFAVGCPWDKGMEEVVQSCKTCVDVNFDDLESQLGIDFNFLESSERF